MRGSLADDLEGVKGVLWGNWPNRAQALAMDTKKSRVLILDLSCLLKILQSFDLEVKHCKN